MRTCPKAEIWVFRLLEQNGMEQEKKQVVQMAEYIDTMEENIVKNLLIIDRMMLGAKAPNYDAYGLFRAAHSHIPAQYSHIVGYISHFYGMTGMPSVCGESPRGA